MHKKKSVKAVVISDLHLGEEESVFSDNFMIDRFWNCISENYSKISEFIILGDIIDLSQAEYPEALYGLKQFFAKIPNGLIDKIIIIPGNHDHHIWYEHYENRIVGDTVSGFKISERFDKIDNLQARNQELKDEYSRMKQKEKYSYKPDKDNFYFFDKNSGCTLTEFIKTNNLLHGIDLEIRYPFYDIKNKNYSIHLHHGHFFGAAYNLFTSLVSELNKPVTSITWRAIDLLLAAFYNGVGIYRSIIIVLALVVALLGVPIVLTFAYSQLWALSFIPLSIVIIAIMGFYFSIYNRVKELKQKLKKGDIPKFTNLKVYEMINAPQYEFVWYLLGQSPMHDLQERAFEVFHAKAGRSIEAGETIDGLRGYIEGYLKIYSYHKLFPKRLKYLMFGHTHRIGLDKDFQYQDSHGRDKKVTVINTGGWLHEDLAELKTNTIFEIGQNGPVGYRLAYDSDSYFMQQLTEKDYNSDILKLASVKRGIKKGIEIGKEEFKKEAHEVKRELKRGL